MEEGNTALGILFPEMVHVTHLAHTITLLCEAIRDCSKDVNGLIENVIEDVEKNS